MKLPALIDLSFILILTSYSKGQSWNISVPQSINATLGSNVIVLCTFTYPPQHHTDNVQVYWKRPVRNSFNTRDKDQNQFVFHTDGAFVVERYRGKTELIGNKSEGNCSLRILDVVDNEPRLYVRLIAKGQNFSFWKNPVSISVSGVAPVTLSQDGTILPLFTSASTHMEGTQDNSHMYAAIFAPLSALLLIVVVATAVSFTVKRKSSQSLTREESGYYANFSRASNDPAQRNESSKNQENKIISESKVIDEPIYVNTTALTGHMDQDHIQNVYGNVDYS